MSAAGARTGLESLTKELLRRWDETKAEWRDVRSEGFEKQYLQELASRVGKTAQLLEKLDAVLARVRDDCE